MITDPWFYAVAIPSVLLMGLSKSGFGAGFGALAVPLMALAVPVPQAAAIMLPLLAIMDAFGIATLWRQRDRALIRLLLPAGPLRELPRKVDFRIRNGQGTDDADAYGMKLKPGFCRNLASDEVRALSDFAGSRVHALAGIGNPDRFFDMLRQSGIQIIEHAFPDHHRFVAADVPEGPVLMTEKDAVKVQAVGRQDLWSVAVDAMLSVAFYAQFNRRLSVEGDPYA